MNKPLISIVIPAFNRALIIGETLDSVLTQSYSNWECIIVDDGSTDETLSMVEDYVQRDNRFKSFKRPQDRKKGASPCKNIGLEMAKGDFIQFLDSDDLLEKSKLEEQIKTLQNYSPLTLITCKWGSFSSSSSVRVKTKYRSYRDFKPGVNLLYNFGKYNEYFPPLAYLVSRNLIEKAGKWDETIPNNPNDDGEYFTRILLHAEQVIFCEKASVYYRAGNTERLSLLDEKGKIESIIKSWKLIEDHLKDKYPKIAAVYVENGKRNIYEHIKNSYPEIIEDNYFFFKKVIPFQKRVMRLLG